MDVAERYRTFWPRFWAGWIDGLVFMPLAAVDWWIHKNYAGTGLAVVWFVVNSFVYPLYSVAMHARHGQTLGKMAMGVKVLDVSGSKLSLRQAVIRDLPVILISVLGVVNGLPRVLLGQEPYGGEDWSLLDELEIYGSMLWFAAELVTMLMSDKRRAIHDLLAQSVVVRLSAVEPRDKAAAA